MKNFCYLVLVLFFGACSVSTEEDTTDYGTSDGRASAPVELAVGTSKNGGVAKYGSSYYKFTPASTGAGSYELNIESLVISDSYSSSAAIDTYIYSDSGYSTLINWGNSCLASCTVYFDYRSFDASTIYYLRIYGYGKVTYKLTISKGGSEGSKNNPVELTLGTAHSGTVEGTSYYGKSYYKFTTVAADNYTLSMNNSDALDCQLYSDSAFLYVVDSYYNECTAGTNISDNFTGTDASYGNPGSGLSANTAYYLMVEGESSSAKTTTYNITVKAAD